MKLSEKKLSIKSVLIITVLLPVFVILVSSIAIVITAKSVQPQDTLDISLLDKTDISVPSTPAEAFEKLENSIEYAVTSGIVKYEKASSTEISDILGSKEEVTEIFSFAKNSFASKINENFSEEGIKYGEDASALRNYLPKSEPDEITSEVNESNVTLTLLYNKTFTNIYSTNDDITAIKLFSKENEQVFSTLGESLVPTGVTYIFTYDSNTDKISSLEVKRSYSYSSHISFKNTLEKIGSTDLSMDITFSDRFNFSFAGIEIEEDIMTLTKDGYDTLTVTPFVEEGLSDDEYSLSFTAFDEYLTVNENGQIEAVKVCDKPIQVTVTLGYLGKTFSDTCVVYVVDAVERVTLSETELSLKVGEAHTLTAEIAPDNATIKTVDYISSDENIVTVSHSGEITAVSEGTATVTVFSTQGFVTSQCTVTVNK